MNLKSLAVPIVAATAFLGARSAAADPTPLDRAYVGVGWMLGEAFATTLEGGVKIPNTPLYAHGLVGHGCTEWHGAALYMPLPACSDGSYRHARAGVEIRGCSSSALCGFLGADGGYQRSLDTPDPGTTEMDTYRRGGPVIDPRAGLDLGWRRFRIRVALDFQQSYESGSFIDGSKWRMHPSFDAALVARF